MQYRKCDIKQIVQGKEKTTTHVCGIVLGSNVRYCLNNNNYFNKYSWMKFKENDYESNCIQISLL